MPQSKPHIRIGDQSERGAALFEYALLVMLIAIVALIAVSYAGEEVSTTFSTIAESVATAGA